MSLIIVDGRSGDAAGVSINNRLNVSARSAARAYYNARFDGQAYTWSNVSYDYTAADTILGVKNTSATLKLHVHGLWLYGDTATLVQIHRPTADVTMAGTAVTAVNLNGASSNVADATAKGDETGNTQGEILLPYYLKAGESQFVPLDDIVTLGQNQMIGVDYVTDGAAASVTILGYFESDVS